MRPNEKNDLLSRAALRFGVRGSQTMSPAELLEQLTYDAPDWAEIYMEDPWAARIALDFPDFNLL